MAMTGSVEGALRPLPAGYHRLYARAVAAAERDDRIRAMWLSGSVGRGVADAGSDLDIVIAIAPDFVADFAADWRAWLAKITPTVLARFLRSGGMTHVLVALAQLADIDFFTARRIVESKQLDGLAIVCKAAELDKALFLTYAVVLLGHSKDALGRAQEYGRLYQDLPRDTAMRTLRFWRMRRQSTDIAA